MMTDFKTRWNLEMALDVLAHKTVDSEIWSEAVKWLLAYGPSNIREVLNQAAGFASHEIYPDLKPRKFTDDGQPCYAVSDLARVLEISEDEVRARIVELGQELGIRHIFDASETTDLQ